MTWVKICGITNLEDAKVAVEAGADAVGFVFYEKSPRNVNPGKVREIIMQLPRQVEKVGVFGGSEIDRDHLGDAYYDLTAMQCHLEALVSEQRKADAPLTAVAPGKRRKAFFVLPAIWVLGQIPQFVSDLAGSPFCDAMFLDSGTREQPGGTGKKFAWEKVASRIDELRQKTNLVVAGGLTPANVTEAMRILKPWGVDVSSGVEARPGKKDPEKVRAFIAAVRAADKNS